MSTTQWLLIISAVLTVVVALMAVIFAKRAPNVRRDTGWETFAGVIFLGIIVTIVMWFITLVWWVASWFVSSF